MAFRLTSKLSRMIFNTLSRSRADATIGDQSITASKAAVNETNQENCRDGKNAKLVLSALHETEPKLIEDPISNPSSFDSLKSQLSKITSSVNVPNNSHIHCKSNRLNSLGVSSSVTDSMFLNPDTSSVSALQSVRTFKSKDSCWDPPPCPDKDCPKFPLDNCCQTDNISCEIYRCNDCKKTECPYTCFSETCYQDPYNKPSECKMCPWKPWNRPFYKNLANKKGFKGFHTVAYKSEDFNINQSEHRNMLQQGTNSHAVVQNSLNFFNNLSEVPNNTYAQKLKQELNTYNTVEKLKSLVKIAIIDNSTDTQTKIIDGEKDIFIKNFVVSFASKKSKHRMDDPLCPKVELPTKPEPKVRCPVKPDTECCPQDAWKKYQQGFLGLKRDKQNQDEE